MLGGITGGSLTQGADAAFFAADRAGDDRRLAAGREVFEDGRARTVTRRLSSFLP
ncbi:MAG: hypothetical protein WCA79_01015 [Anaerolineales bacterium]